MMQWKGERCVYGDIQVRKEFAAEEGVDAIVFASATVGAFAVMA